MNFRKSSEGGEGRGEIISDPKIYVADFCHYKGYFGHEFSEQICNMIFQKGGGSKVVWNFSENSSVLVGGGFP